MISNGVGWAVILPEGACDVNVPSILYEKEFLSALAGAIVGGGIALAGQVVTIRSANKQRREDRRLTQEALANALLFKLIKIVNNLRAVKRVIDSQVEDAQRRGLSGESWQFVRPFANVPPHINFAPEEMGMLLGLKDDKVFNAVAPIDAIHNSTLDLANFFSESRTALTRRLEAEHVDGDHFSGVMTLAQKQRLQPQIFEVGQLLEELRARLEKDYDEAEAALDRLHELFRKKPGITYRLQRRQDA
jgi:hypothetical protein